MDDGEAVDLRAGVGGLTASILAIFKPEQAQFRTVMLDGQGRDDRFGVRFCIRNQSSDIIEERSSQMKIRQSFLQLKL